MTSTSDSSLKTNNSFIYLCLTEEKTSVRENTSWLAKLTIYTQIYSVFVTDR